MKNKYSVLTIIIFVLGLFVIFFTFIESAPGLIIWWFFSWALVRGLHSIWKNRDGKKKKYPKLLSNLWLSVYTLTYTILSGILLKEWLFSDFIQCSAVIILFTSFFLKGLRGLRGNRLSARLGFLNKSGSFTLGLILFVVAMCMLFVWSLLR